MHKRSSFKNDPGMKAHPNVARVLDFMYALPWSVVPFSWMAFLSFPFWAGPFFSVMFIAFILDIFMFGQSKE
jgi:hypothetical protein